jgi:hypothetical protein
MWFQPRDHLLRLVYWCIMLLQRKTILPKLYSFETHASTRFISIIPDFLVSVVPYRPQQHGKLSCNGSIFILTNGKNQIR